MCECVFNLIAHRNTQSIFSHKTKIFVKQALISERQFFLDFSVTPLNHSEFLCNQPTDTDMFFNYIGVKG